MATKKRRLKVPHFEFESFPVEISLKENDLEAIKQDFEIQEKGIYFEGESQLHSVLVLSKKEELKDDNTQDDS